MQTIKTIQSRFIWAAILLVALFPIGARGQRRFAQSAWSGWSSVTVNPNAVNFGRLNVGATSNPVIVTLHNTGRSSITISNVSLSLLQVTYSGPALPATIGAGQSVQATLRFSPNAAQKYSGMVQFTESNGSAASALISGTGVAVTTQAPPPTPAPAKMTLSSSALAFGSVAVGSTTSQNVMVSNGGGSNLTISGVNLTGAGFKTSGVSSGMTLTPGQSSALTVTFDPTATGNMTGSVSISSNRSSSTIALSGSGAAQAAAAKMTLSSSTLAFGSVAVGSTTSQNVTVSNTGGSNLTISGVSMTGAGFGASGISSGQIVTPGQSSVLIVTFDPTASGNMSGSVSISSNASNGTIALSGSGAAPPSASHSASLNWSLDTSAVSGYNVYASNVSGGPYTKLTSAPVSPTSFTDSSVQAGQTYYFVVTAIGTNNTESGYSNEVSAQIP